MKKLLLIAALSVLAATSGSAQTAASSKFRSEDFKKTIQYLAGDKLEGRRTGEKGADAAENYLVDRYREAGLKPALRSGYTQSFPYVTGVSVDPKQTWSTVEFTDAKAKRTKLERTVEIKPLAFSPNASLSNVKIVFAGFGIESKDAQVDDYKGVDASGKAVLVFDGTPDSDNPHSPLGRFDARSKALIAKEHGAVALILISREASLNDDKFMLMRYTQNLGEAALPSFVVSRSLASSLIGADVTDMTTLQGLAAMPKDPHSTSKYGKWDAMPTASLNVKLKKLESNAGNVIGVLEGSDPKLRDEYIVIGAHYDHLGHGGDGSLDVNSTEIHHGADDNASGTAAVIELARYFAKAHSNKRTLVFMAFSGEEEGLLGSNYYVNDPAFPLDKTVAMVNLDMVGRLKNDKLTIGGMGTAKEWSSLVSAENGAGSERFELELSEDGFGPSDHSSFYGKKVPVLFFFTGTHPDYHRSSDTEDKINYDGLVRVTDLVAKLVTAIDGSPTRPTYEVAKSSGMGGGRSGFNISLGTVPSYADSTDGLVLDGVRENSPASKAGLMSGDKIVKLAGRDIRNISDYTFVLGEMRAGTEYDIEVIRGAERLSMKITPVRRQ